MGISLFFQLHLCSTMVLLAASTVLVHPKSRLIPLGREATFTCKFTSDVNGPYWQVNETDASIRSNKNYLKTKGIFIDAQERSHDQQTVTLTLRANTSYGAANNTLIQCKTYSNSESDVATILTITDSPLSPNPLVEQSSAGSLLVKWSPPFLWPMYFVESYNIAVTNNTDRTTEIHSKTSGIFSDPIELFQVIRTNYGQCTNFTFKITPTNHELVNQTKSVNGTLMSPPHNFTVDAIVLFKADGAPVVRVKFQPSPQTCPNQELSYKVTVEERGHETRVIYSSGPLIHNSRQPAEHEISSPNLKRRRIYVMNFTMSTDFESSTKLQEFDTYLDLDPTSEPCTEGIRIHDNRIGSTLSSLPSTFPITSTSEQATTTKSSSFDAIDDANIVHKYKVAMGVCVALVVVMLFTLLSMVVCLVINRQRKISQQKTFDESTNRVQNAMVHNPIYDGPVYESVQPHFDSLSSVMKQDLSSSNTSACNSPPPGGCTSTPPNTLQLQSNQQANVRYLDRPIQPQRSQSLSHTPTPDNNVNQLTMSMQVPAPGRAMALKKNGKERNKLHLTLTLEGANDEANIKPTTSKDVVSTQPKRSEVSEDQGNAPRPDGDENYSVMKPIAGSVMNTMNVELTPEDTEKYRE